MFKKFFHFILFFLICSTYLIDDRIPSVESILNNLDRESDLKFRLGKYKEAESLIRLEDALIQKNHIQSNDGNRFRKLGLINWNLGKLEEATEFFEKARNFYKYCQLNREETISSEVMLNILSGYREGKLTRTNGAIRRSDLLFQNAIVESERIKSPDLEVKCLRQLSGNYWEQRRFEEYLSTCIKALSLASLIQHRKEIGICCNNIGLYFWEKASYSKAIFFINQGLKFSELENATENISICLTNLAVLNFEVGDYRSSLRFIERAIDIDRENKATASLAIDLNNLGLIFKNIYVSCKQIEYAHLSINAFIEALKFAKDEVKSNINNNLGRIYLEIGRTELALSRFQSGLIALDRDVYSEGKLLIWNSLGFCYLEKGQLTAAIDTFQYVFNTTRDHSNLRILWETFFGLGRCFAKQDKLQLAIKYYEKSIDCIDKIRGEISIDLQKTSFNREKSRVYEEIIGLHYRMHEKSRSPTSGDNIFKYVEKAKAQSFYESYERTNRAFEFANDDPIGFIFERNARNRNPFKEIANNICYFIHIYAVLFLKEPTDLRFEKEICTLSTIMNIAAKFNIQIMEYFVMDEMTILFAIDGAGCKIHRLPPRQTIRRSIDGYIKFLETSELPEIVGYYAANRIYREIIKPYFNIYGGENRELIIIPDDSICYLSFESLVVGGSPSVPEYLISHRIISYMPSSSLIAILAKRKFNENGNAFGLIAFGDPDINKNYYRNGIEGLDLLTYRHSAIDKLRFSRKEINDISKYFLGKDRKVYVSSLASEKNLRLMNGIHGSIIHIACHSIISDTNPNETALVLAPDIGGNNDGLVKVREIYNLFFPIEMIVLSSCFTARGVVERLEGVLGLSRVFFIAGVSSVVSTLWAIEDESTSIFMERFYYYLKMGISIASSLRNAKIDIINTKYSSPRYWASYVLYGGIGQNISYFR